MTQTDSLYSFSCDNQFKYDDNLLYVYLVGYRKVSVILMNIIDAYFNGSFYTHGSGCFLTIHCSDFSGITDLCATLGVNVCIKSQSYSDHIEYVNDAHFTPQMENQSSLF